MTENYLSVFNILDRLCKYVYSLLMAGLRISLAVGERLVSRIGQGDDRRAAGLWESDVSENTSHIERVNLKSGARSERFFASQRDVLHFVGLEMPPT